MATSITYQTYCGSPCSLRRDRRSDGQGLLNPPAYWGAGGTTNQTLYTLHHYMSMLHTSPAYPHRSLGLVFPLYCLTHLDKIRVKISMNSYWCWLMRFYSLFLNWCIHKWIKNLQMVFNICRCRSINRQTNCSPNFKIYFMFSTSFIYNLLHFLADSWVS